ncbi:MAG: response regulator transcription factor [Pseudomonadota bacterium]
MSVLIVEDDAVTAAAMVEIAQALGEPARVATTFDACLEALDTVTPDLVVLDRMLPGGDGLDAIAKLRLKGANCMVMVVSALGRSSNRIEGLEMGADDYLAKPFDPDELRARMRALLRRRRVEGMDHDLIVFRDLEIRLKARTVHRDGQHIPLSPREFQLITYFARHAQEVVTRTMLLEHVWNLHFDPQTNVVDVHIGRLRRKLEVNGLPPLIHTVRGEGYLFSADGVGT